MDSCLKKVNESCSMSIPFMALISSRVNRPLKMPRSPLKMSSFFMHSRGLIERAENMLLIPLWFSYHQRRPPFMMSVLALLMPLTCFCKKSRDCLSSSIIPRIAFIDAVFRYLPSSIHECSLYALSLESVARSIQISRSPIQDMLLSFIPHMVMFFPSITSSKVHTLEKYKLSNSD